MESYEAMIVVVLHSIVASVWSRSRVIRRVIRSILHERRSRKGIVPKLKHARCLLIPFLIPGAARLGEKIERIFSTTILLPTFKDSIIHTGGEDTIAMFDKIPSPT